MVKFPFNVKWFIVLLLLSPFPFLFSITTSMTQNSQTDVVQKLREEFTMITPLPNATTNYHNILTKPGLVTVISDYKTFAKQEDIQKYYDNQLTTHGWNFSQQTRSYNNDANATITQIKYKKGNYYADLLFSIDGAGYTFTMSWDVLHQ